MKTGVWWHGHFVNRCCSCAEGPERGDRLELQVAVEMECKIKIRLRCDFTQAEDMKALKEAKKTPTSPHELVAWSAGEGLPCAAEVETG